MVQNIEAVAFAEGTYYDALHYFTNGAKLVKCQGGLTWRTLTKTKPVTTINIRMRPKTKRQVPYSFFGIMLFVPKSGDFSQYMSIADTTDITHVYARLKIRYNEWHQDFDFRRA